jgi:serine/threonine protein kinase
MEFIQRNTLAELLQNNIKISNDIIKQMIFALRDIHSSNIIHRDFSPHNIIMNDHPQVHFIDFGSSKVQSISNFKRPQSVPQNFGSYKINKSEFCSCLDDTPLYSSPQQLVNQNPSFSDDIYNLGLIIYEVLSQFQTFMEKAQAFDLVQLMKILMKNF